MMCMTDREALQKLYDVVLKLMFKGYIQYSKETKDRLWPALDSAQSILYPKTK